MSRPGRTGLKAALAAAGAVGLMSSGVAFATTGHVPFSGALKQVAGQVTGHADDEASTADDEASTPGNGPKSSHSASPNGPKAAALQGLCHAYAKGQKAQHGTALEQRPFQVLVTAAGGEDQVADFCASLPPKAHQGGPGQTHPAHPTHPTTGPSDDPSNGSSDHPTHPAQPTHPTKKPHPTHPTKSSHPTHPTKKPHPDQSTKSQHPDHPTKKPHPSTTHKSTE